MGAFDAFNADGGGGAQDFITRLLQAFGQGGQQSGQNLAAGLQNMIGAPAPPGGGTANPQPPAGGGGVSASGNFNQNNAAPGPAPMFGAPVNGGGGTSATGVTPQNGLAGPLQGLLNPPANPPASGTALSASSGANPNMFGGLPYQWNQNHWNLAPLGAR